MRPPSQRFRALLPLVLLAVALALVAARTWGPSGQEVVPVTRAGTPGLPATGRPAAVSALAQPPRRVSVDEAPEEDDGPAPPPPADEPPEEILDMEEAPPDPIERGPAVLDLALFDARTREPAASPIELWRLGAPGNEHWSSGAQLQASATVPEGGHTFTRLPEGAYRVVCARQAHGATPQEIEVRAPRSQVDLALETPGRFTLRLLLFDRFGERIPEATIEEGDSRWISVSEPWRWERQPRGLTVFEVSEGWPSMGRAPARPLDGPQPEEGFDLGEFDGLDRGAPVQRVLLVRALDDALVQVRVPLDGQGTERMIAVAVSHGELAARVRLPSGKATPSVVEVWGEGLRMRPGDTAAAWHRTRVRIETELGGFRPLDEIWWPTRGELPWMVLEPAE